VADAGSLDFDQHFAFARAFKLDSRYLQWLTSSDCDGGANIHDDSLLLDFHCVIPHEPARTK
jgi:hypothetical protein